MQWFVAEGVSVPVSVHLGVIVVLAAAQRHVLFGERALHLSTVDLQDLGSDFDVMLSIFSNASLHLNLSTARVQLT